MIRTLKTTALAIALVLGTSAGAFAAVAYVEEDTKVKEDPWKSSDTLAWADEGEKVYCDDFENGYAYCERDGKDGWIKKSDLEFKKSKKEVDIEFCFGGFGPSPWGGIGGGHICLD